jgi:feruloyl esterase
MKDFAAGCVNTLIPFVQEKQEKTVTIGKILCAGLVAMSFVFAQQRSPRATSCESLSSLTLPDSTITMATSLTTADKMPGGRGGAAVTVPFCRVAATIKPTSESHIIIEVWMPPPGAWNGKFLGTGNGGAAGRISYPVLSAGVQRGYAATNTDMGSTGSGLDFSFAIGHPELQKDFVFRSTHLMTVIAKQIIQAYYGRPQQRSYFQGCSTGGHEAMTEAQRFPDDYDGIVSGDPANNRTHLHVVNVWNYEAMHESPASLIPVAKLPMINHAVIAACDALDGIVDGVIDDPRRCHFDPATIQCASGADGLNCLTQPQVAALRKVYEGPHNPRTGELIFPGMKPGSEINANGLDRALGNAPGPGLINWASNYTGPKFDFDHDMATVDEQIGWVNDVNPDLSGFRKHGGKLVMYSGWADPLVPSQDLVNFYERIEQKMGGPEKTQQFARLFMVPGMGHCAGGVGPNRFDALAALEPWVEKGTAPERMIASKVANNVTERTRPLCPYPQIARWKGTGSTDDAANFVCVDPLTGSAPPHPIPGRAIAKQ